MLVVRGVEKVAVILGEESQGQVRRGYNLVLLFDALLRPPRVCSLST